MIGDCDRNQADQSGRHDKAASYKRDLIFLFHDWNLLQYGLAAELL